MFFITAQFQSSAILPWCAEAWTHSLCTVPFQQWKLAWNLNFSWGKKLLKQKPQKTSQTTALKLQLLLSYNIMFLKQTQLTVFSNYKPQKNLLSTENQNASRSSQLNCKGCLASSPLPCQWHRTTDESMGSVMENRKRALRKHVFTFIFSDAE